VITLHRKTEGVSDRCEYGGWGFCRLPAAGELRAHSMDRRGKIPWAMCAAHVRPEFHPPDLRKRLVKW
jgi:hypothetical protein